MGQPQQYRSVPYAAPASIGKAAVIEAATHAQTPTAGIKAHQRQQDQVQCPNRTLPRAVYTWLRDAEAVGAQMLTSTHPLKHHLGTRPVIEHGQVNMLASPLGLAQQGPRVDFTIVGQVQGNVPRAAKQWMLSELAQ